MTVMKNAKASARVPTCRRVHEVMPATEEGRPRADNRTGVGLARHKGRQCGDVSPRPPDRRGDSASAGWPDRDRCRDARLGSRQPAGSFGQPEEGARDEGYSIEEESLIHTAHQGVGDE